MSMKELCLVLFGCLSLLVCVQCGYVPEYGKDAETVFITEGELVASGLTVSQWFAVHLYNLRIMITEACLLKAVIEV